MKESVRVLYHHGVVVYGRKGMWRYGSMGGWYRTAYGAAMAYRALRTDSYVNKKQFSRDVGALKRRRR
jgi:hypothetical protein